MFIETEATPNPDTLKFFGEQVLMPSGTANFADIDAADGSPLASALFAVQGVRGVFIGYDFVSVTKATELDWDALQPKILQTLMTFFSSGAPVVSDTFKPALEVEEDEADADIIAQIQTLLEEKVRPAVAGDGGDIVYRGFKEGVVYLEMQGACAGCPSSTITLKHGIENLLRYYVPEVVDVRPVGGF